MRPSGRRNKRIALLWFAIVFVALMAFWQTCVRPYYVEPEYAEIANTTAMYHPHPADWFLGPVNRYATTYTEWTGLSRDFIRPVVAMDYYFWSRIFGSNFAAYLIGTYLCMAGLCGIVFYIAAEILELPLGLCHLCAALVFLSPANLEQERFQATFAPDPMAAFWMLAATLFFLQRRYVAAWILIALAVGTKETAWPLSIGMALLFFLTADRSRRARLLGGMAYLLPLATLLGLRVHAFGLQGIVKGDKTAAIIHSTPSIVSGHQSGIIAMVAAKLTSGPLGFVVARLSRWPFGLMTDSFQYNDRIVQTFSWFGSAFNLIFWAFVAGTILRYAIRRLTSDHELSARESVAKLWPSTLSPRSVQWTLIALTIASLVFPLRFASPPRYGAGTFPLLILTAATVIASRPQVLRRVFAWGYLAGVGTYGLVLMLSDATHGVAVYHRLGQLEASFLSALKSAHGHPVFVVDDVAGGENNSEAFRRALGQDVQVIRVNDLSTSCWYMPEDAPSPVQLSIDASRQGTDTLVIHSSITGCGGHQFFEVPGLPPDPIERTSEGFHMAYQLNPRENSQPTAGPAREMTARIDGVPADAVVIAPDFNRHAYVLVPIH
ncbi:hypothetical protein SAMN05421819_4126 [Bryocella elongata]|uniref:Dolichyl-phosphate-mannose-protein mannosyltransferase n=1 Tax=Bryocella elongata TaxID=863522 RepID=A0A1H6C0D8_9BACT|nr:hypothetical protein [Bryocella elongata]SEG66439.1 hypothetical protein SAMN05421819_4126 [Bryocella elongata]